MPPLTSVWACYGFENPLGGKVSWEDQFGPATGTLRGSKRLCFPASLLGTVPPATTYLCVRNDADKLGPLFQKNVFISSAWLSAKERLEGVDDYCVAATVTITP